MNSALCIILSVLCFLLIGCERSVTIDHSDLGLVLWGPRFVEYRGEIRCCLVDDANVYADYSLSTGERLRKIDLKPFLRSAGVDPDATICATVWLWDDVLAILRLDWPHGLVLANVRTGRTNAIRLMPANADSGVYAPLVFPTQCEPAIVGRDSSSVRLLMALQRVTGEVKDTDEWRHKNHQFAPFTMFRIDRDLSVSVERNMGQYPKYYYTEVVGHMGRSMVCTDTSVWVGFETEPTVTEYRLWDGKLLKTVTVPGTPPIVNVPFDLQRTDASYWSRYFYTTTRAPWVKESNGTLLRGIIVGGKLEHDSIVPRDVHAYDWKVVGTKALEFSGLEYHSNFLEVIDGDLYLLKNDTSSTTMTLVRRAVE